MGQTRCVAVKSEVKEIFDKTLKPAVLKAIESAVSAQIQKYKSKGLKFDQKCKDGWMLTAAVTTLKLDDPDKPTSIEAKIGLDGTPLFAGKGFKASGSAKVSGINAKKMEQEATGVVTAVLEDLMAKKAIPHMLSAS